MVREGLPIYMVMTAKRKLIWLDDKSDPLSIETFQQTIRREVDKKNRLIEREKRKMPEIVFDCDYPKLHGQRTGKLVDVQVRPTKLLDSDFIAYDTEKNDGSFFKLPGGTCLVLTFIGDKGIPFTTIRKYGATKWLLMEENKKEIFKIIIKSPSAIEQTSLPLDCTKGQAL